jgi:hypothetical protein
MKEFLTKNFTTLLVLVLVVIILLQRCGEKSVLTELVIKRDTVIKEYYFTYVDTSYSKPKFIYNIPALKSEIPYIMKADTNYSKLLKQYDSLLQAHYSKNIQIDSTKIDTFGYVKTLDTVQDNRIIGRQWTHNLKIPYKETTITITQTLPSKTQIFLGGSITGSQLNPINGASIGGLLINKKQQVYGVKIGLMNKVGVYGEVSLYWSLNKIFK